jgi:predicted nucleic acid-binding Zn ribbon protein
MDGRGAEVSPQAERAAMAGYLRCESCGTGFPAGRTDKRFCSNRCRAAANRKKQAEKDARKDALIAELAKLTEQP